MVKVWHATTADVFQLLIYPVLIVQAFVTAVVEHALIKGPVFTFSKSKQKKGTVLIEFRNC